jgi:hypothetical protein
MTMTEDYLSLTQIARAVGLRPDRLRNWIAKAEFPEPDVTIGGCYTGWDKERLPELVAWLHAHHRGLQRKFMTWERRRPGHVTARPLSDGD